MALASRAHYLGLAHESLPQCAAKARHHHLQRYTLRFGLRRHISFSRPGSRADGLARHAQHCFAAVPENGLPTWLAI